jgi:hypothetical protein
MSFSFDFGFEAPGASFDNAATVLIFESDATRETLSKTNGPAAIADASRFVELFELQIGISPFAAGLYSEVVGGANLPVKKRARDAADAGKVPVIISRSRTVTGLFCRTGLTALWGKLGRNECNEARLFSHRETFLAGVRAATNSAFKSVTGDVVLLTASHLMRQPAMLQEALARLTGPMHLSIDLDVLSPAEAANSRSVEPGGLDWYTLVDTIESLVDAVKVESVDITGTGAILPRSPAAYLGAQLVLKLAGVLAARNAK